MRLLLIFPPQWNPMNPHFSLYALAGHAKGLGLEFASRDLNVEFFRTILTPKYLDFSHSLAQNALDYLFTRVSLGKFQGDRSPEFAQIASRFFAIKNSLEKEGAVWQKVKRELPKAVSVFNDRQLFYEPKHLARALLTVDKALELISLPYFPSQLRLTDFSAPTHPMTVAGLLNFTENREENPFYHYLESQINSLLKSCHGNTLVGISINSHSQLFGGLTVARLLKRAIAKKKLPITVSLGGNYFVRIRQVILDHPEFFQHFADCLTIGEGEQSLEPLCRAAVGELPFAEVPNLITCGADQKPFFTFEAPPLPLGQRAMPDLDNLDLQRYFTPEVVLASRTSKGCWWQKCTFCDTDYGITPDVRPSQHVLQEWQLVHDKWGIDNFELIDESMTPAYMKQFCREIIASKLKVHYFGNGRTDPDFSQEVLDLMGQSGATMILWGVESGCRRIMKLINKGVDFDKRFQVLRRAHQAGIWNFAFIFFGFPSETEAEARLTIEMLKDNRDIINAYGRSLFTLGKHSKIRGNAQDLGIIDMISDNQEFSTILDYKVSSGLNRQQAAKMAEICRRECAATFHRPLWMLLRCRENIHLYLKEKGHDFLENYKLSEEDYRELNSLFSHSCL